MLYSVRGKMSLSGLNPHFDQNSLKQGFGFCKKFRIKIIRLVILGLGARVRVVRPNVQKGE